MKNIEDRIREIVDERIQEFLTTRLNGLFGGPGPARRGRPPGSTSSAKAKSFAARRPTVVDPKEIKEGLEVRVGVRGRKGGWKLAKVTNVARGKADVELAETGRAITGVPFARVYQT
ncbi:MAG: hypothetical protein ACT4TC_03675 [Myxococcaceae bacterium]